VAPVTSVREYSDGVDVPSQSETDLGNRRGLACNSESICCMYARTACASPKPLLFRAESGAVVSAVGGRDMLRCCRFCGWCESGGLLGRNG
jgi:hypothetical protein